MDALQISLWTIMGVVLLIVILLVIWCIMQIDKLKQFTDPVPVASVDLDKYMGKWYEIARLPNWFETSCSQSTAEYSIVKGSDGTTSYVDVINSCIGLDKDGKIVTNQTAQGKAVPASGAKLVNGNILTPGKLSVSFFPLVSGAYWILDLDSANYQWSLVGTPDRNYLWILSRTPELDPVVTAQLIEKARQLHYPVQNLVFRTPDAPKTQN